MIAPKASFNYEMFVWKRTAESWDELSENQTSAKYDEWFVISTSRAVFLYLISNLNWVLQVTGEELQGPFLP